MSHSGKLDLSPFSYKGASPRAFLEVTIEPGEDSPPNQQSVRAAESPESQSKCERGELPLFLLLPPEVPLRKVGLAA
jgi:hypothetical protein